MKKHFSMIAAAVASSFVISMACIPASAAQYDEQYTVEEDGQMVFYFTTYVDADEYIDEQSVSWTDGNGTKFVHVYKVRPQEDPSMSGSMTLSWKDGSGNMYVDDAAAHTITVYDPEGNVIAVIPE